MKKKISITLVFCTLLMGCYSYKCNELRNANRANLNNLKLGMTKTKVMQIMGESTCENSFTNLIGQKWIFESATNPYRIEILPSKEKTFEILYYLTDIQKDDNAITEDELTPLVFDGGVLIGWGRAFINEKIQKYELRIR